MVEFVLAIGAFLFFCFYKIWNTKGTLMFGNGTTRNIIPTSIKTDDEALIVDGVNKVSYKNGFESYNKEDSLFNLPSSFFKRRDSLPSIPSNRTSLKLLLTGVLFNKSANACDLVFMSGHNQTWRACDSMFCPDSSMHTFPFKLGQEICFKDDFGETLSVNFSEINIRSRYRFEYYTSDYKVTNLTNQNLACLGESSYCYDEYWNRQSYNCNEDAIFRLNKEMKEDKTPQGWSCNVIRNEYNGMYSCCRYFLRAERSSPLYPVYTKVSHSWVAKLIVRQGNSLQEIELSAYDPTTVLLGLKPHTVKSIPIALDSISSPTLSQSPTYLLGYKDRLFFVNGSKVNEAKPNYIGDYQVYLNKTRDVFFMHDGVTCKQKNPGSNSDCSCACNVPESSIQQFQENLDDYKQPGKFVFRGEHFVIDTFHKANEGSFYMKLGEWKISDSPKETAAKCDFNFIMSYGCKHCEEKPYIVIEPRKVEQEGLVSFDSNCSFEKPYLQCDLEPVKLVLMDVYDSCSIDIPTLNKSMVIQVQYLYLGHQIDPSGNISLEETAGEVLRHITASEHFTRGFIGTLLLCLILEFVFLFVCLKILSERRRKANDMRETPLVAFFNR